MQPNGTVAFQPFVIAPATVYVAPEPVVMVPETYVVVGEETFGFVGGQYVYLGAGNVWLVCDSYRLERFHGWERDHPDWREHAIRNEIYRRDAQGHENKSVAFGLVSQVMANSIRMLGLARPNNNSRSKKVNRSKSRKTRKKQTKTRNRSETNIATKTTNHRKELTL